MLAINNKKDTEKFAQDFAKNLKGGEIVALDGELGAGKTFFVQAVAKRLGIKNTVNSPTFVIMKVYDAEKGKIKKMVHIDAYRLSSAEDLSVIGALEYFNKNDTVVFVEWASKIKEILPSKTVFLKFEIKDKHKRTVKMSNL